MWRIKNLITSLKIHNELVKNVALEKQILETLIEIKNLLAPKTIEDARYLDNKDGSVSDKKTGLMWAKDSSEDEMNWSDAEAYCKKLNLAGHSDWRLPTVEELFGLVDRSKTDPAINPVFGCRSSYHWSSAPYAGVSDFAWLVSFSSGYVYWGGRGYKFFVRPVRQY